MEMMFVVVFITDGLIRNGLVVDVLPSFFFVHNFIFFVVGYYCRLQPLLCVSRFYVLGADFAPFT